MDISTIRAGLFSKLLDQDKPIISEKMLPLLLQEGAASALINFLTRTNPSALPPNTAPPPPSPPPASFQQVVSGTSKNGIFDDNLFGVLRASVGEDNPVNDTHPTEPDDYAEKRGTTLLALFLAPSPAFAHFINKRVEELVVALFAVFEGTQGLQCNMVVWQRAVDKLTQLEPVRVAEAMESNHAVFSKALSYTSHTPVMNVLMRFIEEFMKFGVSRKIAWLLRFAARNMCADGDLGTGCADFVAKVLDVHGPAFATLQDEGKKEYAFITPVGEPEFVNKLVASVRSGAPGSSRVFDVLVLLAKTGGTLSRLVLGGVPSLAEAVIFLDAEGALPQDKLSFARWGLVNVLTALFPGNAKQVLDVISVDTWRALSSWFLRFSHSSLYHQQFFILVGAAIEMQHEQSLISLFVKCDFLQKMTENYKISTIGGRGYIPLINNMLLEGSAKFIAPTTPDKQTTPTASPQSQRKGSGKKKGGKAQVKNKGKKTPQNSPLAGDDEDEVLPQVPFWQYLQSQGVWKDFAEEVAAKEAEQQKNAIKPPPPPEGGISHMFNKEFV